MTLWLGAFLDVFYYIIFYRYIIVYNIEGIFMILSEDYFYPFLDCFPKNVSMYRAACPGDLPNLCFRVCTPRIDSCFFELVGTQEDLARPLVRALGARRVGHLVAQRRSRVSHTHPTPLLWRPLLVCCAHADGVPAPGACSPPYCQLIKKKSWKIIYVMPRDSK